MKTNNKKNIAVIFGGKSAEHDVSIVTAHIPIIDSLVISKKYNIIPIYINKEGIWYSSKEMIKLSFFQDKDYLNKLNKKDKVQIFIEDGFFVKQNNLFSEKIKIDLVFPALHGTYGEDGSLTGLLRMANVPFVGCDIFASAVAMDKVLTKQILSSENIPVTKYEWFTKKDFEIKKEEILNSIKNLNYPLFIKPVHLGSSIGITKAKNEKELINGIEVALFYDDKILVEEGVNNLIEVTLPMIGNNEILFGNIERPLSKEDFFDFNTKYINSNSKISNNGVNTEYSEIPAKIDQFFKDKVLDYAKKTFNILGCSGIVRIDFLINEFTKEVFVNEVNTLPGSLYAHNFKKSGITNLELVDKLIDYAFERFESKNAIINNFDSKILQSVGGGKKQ
ncbi:MAG: D-alanine--D-alanine ligase family protein [Candidatus Nomurabacteria bacterium]